MTTPIKGNDFLLFLLSVCFTVFTLFIIHCPTLQYSVQNYATIVESRLNPPLLIFGYNEEKRRLGNYLASDCQVTNFCFCIDSQYVAFLGKKEKI